MMMTMNGYTSLMGFGVFHSGVEVYGNEFAYGGHIFPVSGIYDMKPKDVMVLGEDFNYKESIILGHTNFTKQEVDQLISHLGHDYKGNTYDIVRKNCNHFTDEFCLMLCGKRIPKWINRLAYMISCVPFMEKYLLRTMEPSNMLNTNFIERTPTTTQIPVDENNVPDENNNTVSV